MQTYGFVFVAILVGVGYWYLLGRTRFGFDLRATGRSATAAVASGVNVKRMVLVSMVLSAARSPGWSACPSCSARPTSTTCRSRPASASPASRSRCSAATRRSASAIAALFFAYLEHLEQPAADHRRTSPRRSSQIMQGIIMFAVVVAYELVRRYGVAREQRRVGRQLTAGPAPRRRR